MVHGSLEDNAFGQLVVCESDGFVEKRLVGKYALAFDAAGSRDDDSGLGVVDAHGKFVRSEAPKNDGMHGTETRAGEHRNRSFRNHGHVDNDAVALYDILLREHTGKARNGVAEFAVGEGLDLIGDGAVINERGLIGAAGFYMEVERVIAGVELTAAEPAIKRRTGVVENCVPLFVPMDCGCGFSPKGFGVANRTNKSRLQDAVRAAVHG